MKKKSAIFGLRYDANEKLLPFDEDLRVFLKSAPAQYDKDLEAYSRLIEDMQDFEQLELQGQSSHEVRNKIFHHVLDLSCFVNHALLSAVVEYHYHLHTLLSLDFNKPVAFIHSAEAEMSRFNPKKKDDAAKLTRLKGMVEDRKQMIELLKKQRAAVTSELTNIARYISDNLFKVASRCEASIVVLVEFQLQKKKETQLIEDIKAYFKEQLRESLSDGPISKERLEAAKNDVDLLAKEISALLREDVYAITGLFEAIYDHVKGKAGEINSLIARSGGNGDKESEGAAARFVQLGQVLISLMSAYQFELHMNEVRTETAHHAIFLEKRKEMLAHLFKMLETERRSSTDRRSGKKRRNYAGPDRRDLERRKCPERRTGKNRRKAE